MDVDSGYYYAAVGHFPTMSGPTGYYLWTAVIVSLQLVVGAVEDTKSNLEKDIEELSRVQPSDIVLTPYWERLRFAVGETVVVDCGVYTGGRPQGVDITWTGPGDKPLSINNRAKTQRRDKRRDKDTSAGAFSVSTITITHLQDTDSGTYTCTVKQSTGNRAPLTANFTLMVEKSDALCGFEGTPNAPYLCGWSIDNKSGIAWHVHTGADDVIINRNKGARFDHTYGPSKHIGHFLDVDPSHADESDKNGTARLVSPTYTQHTDYKCLQLWYIYRGKDSGSLKVYLHNATDPESFVRELWSVTEDQGNEWRLAQINLDPQTRDYHIHIEAACTDSCRRMTVSIDDVSITSGKCTEAPDWPKSNLKVRLVGGSKPTEGLVEILHDGQWGSVCSREFGLKEAAVICNSLGYSSANATRCRNAHFGRSPSGSMIWLERLGCKVDKETDVASCIIAGETWGDTNCTHEEDAGIICSAEPVQCTTTKSAAPPITTLPMKTNPPVTVTPTTKVLSTTVMKKTSTTMMSSTVKLTKKPLSTHEPVVSPTKVPTTQTGTSTFRPTVNITKITPASKPNKTTTEHTTSKPTTSRKTSIVQPPSTVPYRIINASIPTTTTTKLPMVVTNKPTSATSKPTSVASVATPTKLSSQSSSRKKSPKERTSPMPPALTSTPPPLGSTMGVHFVSPDKPKVVTSTQPTTRPVSQSKPAKTNPEIASLPPEVEQYNPGSNAGVAIGIIFALVIASSGLAILLYKRKRKGKKSTYITFGNPSYSREHLPANDFSLESPLTLSSNGYTVLA